uniref:Uncharacterized protein n=1 Tax=Marinobacter nauticus TaxID=2743 RepID=A0A455W629_MARNT|nr:hypothetical protein YBY_02450 [Marinobacter nauticus]
MLNRKDTGSFRYRRWIRYGLILAVLILIYWFLATYLRGEAIFKMEDRYFQPIDSDVPENLTSMSAKECGSCHVEMYEDWKHSMHAKAHTDPYYQAYWDFDDQNIVCRSCHTPLSQQWPELVTRLPDNSRSLKGMVTEPNPDYDPELEQEGITCAACHVRDGVIYGPFEASTLNAPHPVAYDPDFTNYKICADCHDVKEDTFQFYQSEGVCGSMADFVGNSYNQAGFECQSCHMPAVESPLVPGFEKRKVRRHLWTGGHSPAMVKFALAMDFNTDDQTAFLKLRNDKAGHAVPNGDPDRKLIVNLRAFDAEERILKEEEWVLGRTILWWPLIVELYDNRLDINEERSFELKLPSNTARVGAQVRYLVVTERQHKRLVEKHGLPPETRREYSVFREQIGLGERIKIEIPEDTPAFYGPAEDYWRWPEE